MLRFSHKYLCMNFSGAKTIQKCMACLEIGDKNLFHRNKMFALFQFAGCKNNACYTFVHISSK